MVVYPNGDKSLMIEYEFMDKVLFNSLILNTNSKNEIARLKLLDVKKNTDISNLWFSCPYSDSVEVPDFIKVGKFIPKNGKSILERQEYVQNERTLDGSINTRLGLKWVNSDSYRMIDEKTLTSKNIDAKDDILVRVISWHKNGYVCHYFTEGGFGTQEYSMAAK